VIVLRRTIRLLAIFHLINLGLEVFEHNLIQVRL